MKKYLKIGWKDKHQINDSGCFYGDDSWKGVRGGTLSLFSILYFRKMVFEGKKIKVDGNFRWHKIRHLYFCFLEFSTKGIYKSNYVENYSNDMNKNYIYLGNI